MESSFTRGTNRGQSAQKKGWDISSHNMSSGMAENLNSSGVKRAGDLCVRRTPAKTPRKSPGRREGVGTPGRRTPGGGDRFIPNRLAMDYEAAHYKLVKENPIDPEEICSPMKKEYQRVLQESLEIQDPNQTRILSFLNKAPTGTEGPSSGLKVLYSHTKTPVSARKANRFIPQAPERILDAPDILNDYYLNLVDWSCNNHLAVALGSTIYLWNASSGHISKLMDLEGSDYVCSVKWIKEGNYLAVGNSLGEVQLWDVEKNKRSRSMIGHTGRVSSLSWNSYIVSSGSRSGNIFHSDVRIQNHLVSSSQGHTQEVCGLAWSPDGRQLASGGNDNLLNIWSADGGECFATGAPIHSLTHHQAAVRGVAWCPWQSGILATGGGTNDRTIKLWNSQNGHLVNSVETGSQVCSLVWNSEYRELVSSHGYPTNQINIWKHPAMTKVAELTGHTERVLHLSLSPDGSTLLSGGADETLRLWNCFPVDPTRKKSSLQTKTGPISSLRLGIR